MNTLHIDLGLEWRGGQDQALLLVRGLQARGHAAELVAVRGTPMARRAEAAGVRLHTVGRLSPRLRAALQIRRLVEGARFDVVHAHDAHGLTAAWLAGAHKRAGLVASRRVAYPLSKSRLALARYRSAHRIVPVSRFVESSVLASGPPSNRVEVIYDGVAVPPLPTPEERNRARAQWGLAPPGGVPLLGCVGYLLPEKGQELLVRAMPMILEQHGDCRLLLAGDGPSRRGLERLARELGVEKAALFAGFVEDVPRVYRALDVFLFSSPAEPLGSSLLAAMAHGLPAVVVAGGAAPEIIEDGRNGLLVAAREPARVAAAVIRLLRDPELASRLGGEARRTVEERFAAERMVDETLDLYRRVLTDRC